MKIKIGSIIASINSEVLPNGLYIVEDSCADRFLLRKNSDGLITFLTKKEYNDNSKNIEVCNDKI